jgi:NAD(P)-dependent dehydrogenase (short-subunit alcohol dehydrogenase family)
MTKRVALITGASGGIGAAVAKALAEQGQLVAAGYAGRPDAAAATVEQIETSRRPSARSSCWSTPPVSTATNSCCS